MQNNLTIIKQLSRCVSDDGSRPAIRNIQFDHRKGKAVASNGRILAMKYIKKTKVEPQYLDSNNFDFEKVKLKNCPGQPIESLSDYNGETLPNYESVIPDFKGKKTTKLIVSRDILDILVKMANEQKAKKHDTSITLEFESEDTVTSAIKFKINTLDEENEVAGVFMAMRK